MTVSPAEARAAGELKDEAILSAVDEMRENRSEELAP
jgi:hypothetical protein